MSKKQSVNTTIFKMVTNPGRNGLYNAEIDGIAIRNVHVNEKDVDGVAEYEAEVSGICKRFKKK